jgi:hypothetical protein
VTLDPDVAARVKQLARERGIPFKEALNSTIRAGLAGEAPSPRPYRLRARNLRLRPGVDLDKALRLAASLEDEASLRKLDLRK